MEIPLQAQVACADGAFGSSLYVIINPVIDQITHLVVRATGTPHTEYIVPIGTVSTTTDNTIQLRCSKSDLEKMPPFVKTEYIQRKMPAYSGYHGGSYGVGAYYYMPYVTSQIPVQVPVEHQQIPAGELAVRRGTHVNATDGHVGHIDEFVIDAQNGHITHLVMREGHLWGQKDVIIPISAMGETDEDTVFLNIDKRQIESLPTVPVKRHWS